MNLNGVLRTGIHLNFNIMFWIKKIRYRVYNMYLAGVDVITISTHMSITPCEVNEIIDYMNDIYLN